MKALPGALCAETPAVLCLNTAANTYTHSHIDASARAKPSVPTAEPNQGL